MNNSVINLSAVFKEFVRKIEAQHSYITIRKAIQGDLDKGKLSDQEKKALCQIIEDSAKYAKRNILKS